MCNARTSRSSEESRSRSTSSRSGSGSGIMRVRTLRDSLSSCSDDNDIHNIQNSSSSDAANAVAVAALDASQSSTSTSSTNSTRSSGSGSSSGSSVRFKEVQIREYAVTIGDNPSCSNGAPISLDWMHTPSDFRIHLETYEEAREPHRRNQAQLKMPSRVRMEMLMDGWDYSLKSILVAQRETDKLRQDRKKTSDKARRAMMREESFHAAKKSVKNFFTLRNGTGNKKKGAVEVVETVLSDISDDGL